jgi:hypothetical protein
MLVFVCDFVQDSEDEKAMLIFFLLVCLAVVHPQLGSFEGLCIHTSRHSPFR